MTWTITESTLEVVRPLFQRFHAYASIGNTATYCFAVHEGQNLVAGFLWQPPAPGAAKSVCEELPHGVLALSRMVAVPKKERTMKHISKPLKKQMKHLIDRTRWPVLITYSDESVGHNGYVYQCSGWQPTKRSETPTLTVGGSRVSSYSAGHHVTHDGAVKGTAWIQRWEHWITKTPASLFALFWKRIEVPGKFWRNGKQAHTYVKLGAA